MLRLATPVCPIAKTRQLAVQRIPEEGRKEEADKIDNDRKIFRRWMTTIMHDEDISSARTEGTKSK